MTQELTNSELVAALVTDSLRNNTYDYETLTEQTGLLKSEIKQRISAYGQAGVSMTGSEIMASRLSGKNLQQLAQETGVAYSVLRQRVCEYVEGLKKVEAERKSAEAQAEAQEEDELNVERDITNVYAKGTLEKLITETLGELDFTLTSSEDENGQGLSDEDECEIKAFVGGKRVGTVVLVAPNGVNSRAWMGFKPKDCDWLDIGGDIENAADYLAKRIRSAHARTTQKT